MKRQLEFLTRSVTKYTMIIAMLAIWTYFQIATNGIFMMPRNITNLFLQMCYIGISSCGMVMIMVAGQIDLSAGSVIGFTGAIIALLLKHWNWPLLPAVLVTIIVGALVGLWQGFWVAKVGLPAFIVTLSSLMLFRGGVLGVTSERTIQPNNDLFKQIGQGYLGNLGSGSINVTAIIVGFICYAVYIILKLRTRAKRKKNGFNVENISILMIKFITFAVVIAFVFGVFALDRGIPYAIIILAVVVLVMHIIANNTPYGRHIYAIGGNAEAAQLSGINVAKTIMIDFVIMGVLTSISGIVYTARLNSAAIGGGTGAETDIIAAAIIGGTSPAGGKGTIFGCIIGALVMASLENGMSILSLGSFEKYVVKGLVLLFAVAVDTISNKQKV